MDCPTCQVELDDRDTHCFQCEQPIGGPAEENPAPPVSILLGDPKPVRVTFNGIEHKMTKAEGWEFLDLLNAMMSMCGE